jgi:hypothetical protein
MKLIVVPEAHRESAEAVLQSALAEQNTASGQFAFTLIRLPGTQEWRVHASSNAGNDVALARLVQRKLREAGL